MHQNCPIIFHMVNFVLVRVQTICHKLTRNTHCAKHFVQQDTYAVCMLCVASRKVKYYYVKQKHLGCKKVQGQSEATLQTGKCDQKV